MKAILFILSIFITTSLFAFPSGYATKEIYNGITTNTATGVTNAAAIVINTATGVTNATAITLKRSFQQYEVDATATLAAAATVVFASNQIPAGSIVTNVFFEVDTQVVSADSNTIAFVCGSATMLSAADISASVVDAIVAGTIVSQTIAGHTNVGAAACSPTFTIGAGASGLTAGVVQFFVEYITQ